MKDNIYVRTENGEIGKNDDVYPWDGIVKKSNNIKDLIEVRRYS